MYFGLNSTSLAEYFFSRLTCDKVCLPVEGGGLGIRKVFGLLGKQLWQFGKEVNRLWHKVITKKYVEDKGGWYSRAVRGTHGYGMWKEYLGWCRKLLWTSGVYCREGHCIRFYYDPWYGHTPLKDLYPDLFACFVSKESWISNLIIPTLEGGYRGQNV